LTEFLGGHLRVQSASGTGTQFTIALPVYAGHGQTVRH